MHASPKHDLWNVTIAAGVALFLLHSVLFILFGQANADEGWYLYASKLVYSGQSPYRDFAFTQTPLLPYIYGIPQTLIAPGLYLGRITSVVFSTLACLLSLRTANTYGGRAAAGVTAWLWATFTYGIYLQSITKTYALTTFFFSLAFFVLSSNVRRDLRLILSTVLVLLAALTRLSAVFFAVPFLVYAFMVSDTRTKLGILALCLGASGWMLVLTLPNIDGAMWGLILHHSSGWGDVLLREQIAQILSARIPLLFITFPAYFLLWAAVISMMGIDQTKRIFKDHFAMFVLAAGLVLFAMSNLVSGNFYVEYFVPLMFISFPITGIAYAKIADQLGPYVKITLNILLWSTMALGLVRGGYSFIDNSGEQAPVEEIREVSAVISEHSRPGDTVLALEALWLVVESDRLVLPNMTMAHVSFYDTDTDQADRLHLVNGQTILGYIDDCAPKVIALTELDWDILRTSSTYERIAASLEKNYALEYSREEFGQRNSRIEIYVQREDQCDAPGGAGGEPADLTVTVGTVIK